MAAVLTASILGLAVSTTAQNRPQTRSVYDRYTEPIAIFTTGLGTFTKSISSTNKEAQAYVDQGFQMMYSFAKPEAVRSFREAWKRDPACAICYWGEAWAWGSYLNAPMRDEEAPHAFAAAQKALALKNKATPKERALIDAMAVRYVEKFDAAKRVEQDRAYRDAMAKVAAQYPDDLEILEGEIQRMAGDLPSAIASFRRAADVQEGLQYDEPEPLPFAAHHWLGAALLESGRFEEAEKVYRADLEEHPRNGWSLFGLQQALAGRKIPIEEVAEEFAASWARADTWIRASRF